MKTRNSLSEIQDDPKEPLACFPYAYFRLAHARIRCLLAHSSEKEAEKTRDISPWKGLAPSVFFAKPVREVVSTRLEYIRCLSSAPIPLSVWDCTIKLHPKWARVYWKFDCHDRQPISCDSTH